MTCWMKTRWKLGKPNLFVDKVGDLDDELRALRSLAPPSTELHMRAGELFSVRFSRDRWLIRDGCLSKTAPIRSAASASGRAACED
jgi:hypothetical protein